MSANGVKKHNKQAIQHAVESIRPMTRDRALSNQLFKLAEQNDVPLELRSLLLDCSAYTAGMFDENPTYRLFDVEAISAKIMTLLAGKAR